MSIEGQVHFFTMYFSGFVCFVLYKAMISGEHLQDHWSSGFYLGTLGCFVGFVTSDFIFFPHRLLLQPPTPIKTSKTRRNWFKLEEHQNTVE